MSKTTPLGTLAQDIITVMSKGTLTVPELTVIAKTASDMVKAKIKFDTIMNGSTITEGDRVRINESYYYKTLIGLTGEVTQVQAYGGKRFHCYFVVRLDTIPARRPKWTPNANGEVTVYGHQVDLLPAGS